MNDWSETQWQIFGKSCPLIFSAQMRLAWLKWSCVPFVPRSTSLIWNVHTVMKKPIWKWQFTVAQAFHWTFARTGRTGTYQLEFTAIPMHMLTNYSIVLTCGWVWICYPVGLTVLNSHSVACAGWTLIGERNSRRYYSIHWLDIETWVTQKYSQVQTLCSNDCVFDK